MKTSIRSFTFILLCNVFLVFTSCEFSFSTGNSEKGENLSKKMSVKENGLKTESIVLHDGREEITSSRLVYGTTLNFDFDEVSGFTEVDESVYPGLGMTVLNKNKDTIVHQADVFAKRSDSIEAKGLNLKAYITLGEPINSGNDYTVKLHFWDKKGTGTLDASLDITVIPNKNINIEQNDLEYGEIFLYSDKRGVITDRKVVLNENIFIVFDNLEGLKVINGKVSIAASMEARNSFGIKMMDKKDVFKGQNIIPVEKLKGRDCSLHYLR